nr:DUF4280 domain-containing protein [uncultured Clostridium sp.]
MENKEETYVVHSAPVKCSMGMRSSKVALQLSHGVFLQNMPQVTAKDCKGKLNVLSFGGCFSGENPKTQEKAKEIAKEVKEEKGISFEEQVLDIFCASDGDENSSVKRLECVGECMPVILADSWDEVNETVEINGDQPIKGSATLMCKYGGKIEFIQTGQTE